MKKAIVAISVCLMLSLLVIMSYAGEIGNLYESSTASGYYANGKLVSSQNYKTSALIAVKPGETVSAGIISPSMSTAIPLFEFSDSLKKFTEDKNIKEVEIEKHSNTVAIASCVVPENAAYVRVNCDMENAANFVVTNEKMTVDGYYEFTKQEKPIIRIDSPLYGKTILFVGDSICNAQCENDNNKAYPAYGWAGRIGVNNDMIWNNAGVSGASISSIRGSNTVLNQLKQAAIKASTYDIVLLHGGVNDGWDNAAVGTMTAEDNFDQTTFNRDTFAGGLEYTIWYAKKYFTKAEIGFIVNARTPSGNGSLYNMTSYWNTAMKICDKWGIPYIDLYNNETLKKTAIPTCGGDNIHPTHDGYDIIYPYIEAFAESLVKAVPTPTPTASGTETPFETPIETTAQKTTTPATTSPITAATTATTAETQENGGNNTVLFIIIGAALVLVAVSVTVIIIKKKK